MNKLILCGAAFLSFLLLCPAAGISDGSNGMRYVYPGLAPVAEPLYGAPEQAVFPPNGHSNNELILKEGPSVFAAYGGFSIDDAAVVQSNMVVVRGFCFNPLARGYDDSIVVGVHGGYSKGAARHNTVRVKNGDLVRVTGGRTEQGDSAYNEVRIEDGNVEEIYSGYSQYSAARHNLVSVSGGTVEKIIGGQGVEGTDNSIVVSGGTVMVIIAGQGVNTTNNSINISGGKVWGNITAARAERNGICTGNIVIVSGGDVSQGTANAGGRNKGNIVIVRGDTVRGLAVEDAEELRLEGFCGDLDRITRVKRVIVDERSRMGDGTSNFGTLSDEVEELINNGVMTANVYTTTMYPQFIDEPLKPEYLTGDSISFRAVTYSGSGGFELMAGQRTSDGYLQTVIGNINIFSSTINVPLRLGIKSDKPLKSFEDEEVADLYDIRFGPGLTPENAVVLVTPKAGGLTLSLRYEEKPAEEGKYSCKTWYLSGR